MSNWPELSDRCDRHNRPVGAVNPGLDFASFAVAHADSEDRLSAADEP